MCDGGPFDFEDKAIEDGAFAAPEGFEEFPPHLISPIHEQTLEAAFLFIHELLHRVNELTRRIEDLENGR